MMTKAERLRILKNYYKEDPPIGDYISVPKEDWQWLIEQVEATIKPKTRSSDGLAWYPNTLEGSNALNVCPIDREGKALGLWATYIPKGCHVRNALRHFKESHPKVCFHSVSATLEKRGVITNWSFYKDQL